MLEIQAWVTRLKLSITTFFSKHTPLQIHSRNSAARDTHSDKLRGLGVRQCIPAFPAPSQHVLLEKLREAKPMVVLMSGKPVSKKETGSPRGLQNTCPSTPETSVKTSHNVAGTICGTAKGNALEITFSTQLTGLCGVCGGKWKEWRCGDQMA